MQQTTQRNLKAMIFYGFHNINDYLQSSNLDAKCGSFYINGDYQDYWVLSEQELKKGGGG